METGVQRSRYYVMINKEKMKKNKNSVRDLSIVGMAKKVRSLLDNQDTINVYLVKWKKSKGSVKRCKYLGHPSYARLNYNEMDFGSYCYQPDKKHHYDCIYLMTVSGEPIGMLPLPSESQEMDKGGALNLDLKFSINESKEKNEQ